MAKPSSLPVKPTTALLTASLLANVALVAAYVATNRSPASGAAKVASAKPAMTGRASSPAPSDALRNALESGDAAALQAAGVAPEVARDLALGRAFARIAEKIRAARAAQSGDNRWWRQREAAPGSREQLLQVRREISDAMFAAFGEDLSTLGSNAGSLAFLSPEKRDALRRILQDYEEMMAKYGAGGIQLASDREKLRLLRAERDRDIGALLTPDERLAYEMRTSPSAATVRARYGEGIETEEDFRKLYALQKAFDEKYPLDATTGRVNPEVMRQRMDAQRQLHDDVRAALGDEKFAAVRRASDSDLRNVESLVTRLNLPAATTDQVVAARESLAAEAQRISNAPTLPPPQRRSQIQELATKAKADLTRALGAEAADAYAQRSPWVGMLQGGIAYSTTPPAGATNLMTIGQSVYPVMPAGSRDSPAVSRVVVTGGQTVDTGPGGGDLFFTHGTGAPAVRENVQVMTFSTTTSGEPPAAGAGTVEKRIVVPVQPAPKP